MAIHVVLNELNAPFKLERVDFKNKSPAFLKANPRGGRVCVLEENGFVLREGAAILLTLLEKHKSALLPQSDKERARAIEWLMFANATLHPAYGKAFFLLKHLGDKAMASPLMQAACEQINGYWAELDKQLAGGGYLCGKECTVADILVTVIANWSGNFGGAITLGQNVKRLLKSVVTRPAYQKALAEEQVEYKAAA